jgi:PKHD-type hydroxylase
MNLKNYYYYYQGALPLNFCDKVMQLGLSKQSQMAVTGDVGTTPDLSKLTKDQIQNVQKKRKSEVVWLDEQWIYNQIHPFINEANKKAGWNFQWDFSEHPQFTKYGVGQYYGWHCDSWEVPYNNPQNKQTHGKIRKLSVTISLSDPKEYEGGNLEFDYRNSVDWERNKTAGIHTCTEIRPRGSIIIFPSFVWHRVSPVTKGVRHSLVLWNLGFPWK